jgi:soluble lytic murein transglycosylase-like protein
MAHSGAGAYGLMQLTAETAARLAGDASLKRNPGRLHDPGLNLRLGQDYVSKLLGAVGGDMLKAVAAYNCGPGVIFKMMGKLGGDNGDSLLMLESMPAGQTRQFVQRVMSNYWIYRQIFGLESHTLTAAATGNRAVAALDRPAK